MRTINVRIQKMLASIIFNRRLVIAKFGRKKGYPVKTAFLKIMLVCVKK